MATTASSNVQWTTPPSRWTRREKKRSGRRTIRDPALIGAIATGVTEGNPGSFTGGRDPFDLDELRAWGALGETTAWATGNNVVLGDGSLAHWDGDSWEAGAAPV